MWFAVEDLKLLVNIASGAIAYGSGVQRYPTMIGPFEVEPIVRSFQSEILPRSERKD